MQAAAAPAMMASNPYGAQAAGAAVRLASAAAIASAHGSTCDPQTS